MNMTLLTSLLGMVVMLAVWVLVRRRPARQRLLALLVTLIIVGLVGRWATHQVPLGMPDAVDNASNTDFDSTMNRVPLYQAIQQQEPAVWQQLHSQAMALHEQGKTDQQMIDAMQAQVLRISMQRLQQTPDAQAVAYMKANMAQTALLQKQGPEICFRFLFPAVHGGINPVQYLSQDQINQRMQVDVEMYNASFGATKHTVTPAEREQAHQDLQPIIMALSKQYGDDFQLVAEPAKAAGKEAEVCQMVQDIWQGVFKLPESRAAAVVRYSVSGQQ